MIITVCWLCFMVMVLWNALMPVIIKAQPVNFVQAAGLLLLGRLITGGIKFDWFNSNKGNRQEMKESFREKWARHCMMPNSEKPVNKENDIR